MAEAYPTFKFWDLIEMLETLILIFCRAHRQKKFPLCVEALEQLIPFFFIKTMLDGHPCTLEI